MRNSGCRRGALAPLVLFCALTLTACDGWAQVATSRGAIPALSDSAWGALVLSLSEEGGYFDTDNLISNERSYLHVLAPLRRMGGGAYVEVGPDQSFSYLAAARPAVAFLIDIRRDNLLQHLLLRSLFALSSNRAEYLARLHGRAPPENARAWDDRTLEAILDRVDSLPADPDAVRATRQAVATLVRALPLPLSDADLATIERFHQEFVAQGTGLRFRRFGRAPQPYYPNYRQLLLETEARGLQGSFLVSEEDFRWVKDFLGSEPGGARGRGPGGSARDPGGGGLARRAWRGGERVLHLERRGLSVAGWGLSGVRGQRTGASLDLRRRDHPELLRLREPRGISTIMLSSSGGAAPGARSCRGCVIGPHRRKVDRARQ